MASFGLSFLPSDDADSQKDASNQLSPTQRAIQVIGLKLPRVLGTRKIAPRELMGAAGGLGAAKAQEAFGVSPDSALFQTFSRNRDLLTPEPSAPSSPSVGSLSAPLSSSTLPSSSRPSSPLSSPAPDAPVFSTGQPSAAAEAGSFAGGAGGSRAPSSFSSSVIPSVPSSPVLGPMSAADEGRSAQAVFSQLAATPSPSIPPSQGDRLAPPRTPQQQFDPSPVFTPGANKEPPAFPTPPLMPPPPAVPVVSPPVPGDRFDDGRPQFPGTSGDSQIPDRGPKLPKDDRPPFFPQPPSLPPINEPGPPPGRFPQSPRDPNEPVVIVPAPPDALGPDGGGSWPPVPPPNDGGWSSPSLPPVHMPPSEMFEEPGPPPGRVPQSPRDPNAPIDLLPPPVMPQPPADSGMPPWTPDGGSSDVLSEVLAMMGDSPKEAQSLAAIIQSALDDSENMRRRGARGGF